MKLSTAKLLKRVPTVPMSAFSANMRSQSLNVALSQQNNSKRMADARYDTTGATVAHVGNLDLTLNANSFKAVRTNCKCTNMQNMP